MASKLSYSDFPPTLQQFPKYPQSKCPFYLLQHVNLSSSCCYFKCISSSRGEVSSSSPLSSSSSAVVRALKEEVIQSPTSESAHDTQTASPTSSSSPSSSSSSKLVLVVGGSGGVGQLVVASLLDRNIKCRLFLRDPVKANALFGNQDEDKLQVFKGDTRNPEDLDPSMLEGVTHVICCTGTTAFPSRRWDGDNTPERVGKKLYSEQSVTRVISRRKREVCLNSNCKL
uniref:NAD(P)-binding domain-containing protein n=1 Tax=Rhizophora mucronata TaxID=61149 RepID=A0A2P2IYP1_RHIMU